MWTKQTELIYLAQFVLELLDFHLLLSISLKKKQKKLRHLIQVSL